MRFKKKLLLAILGLALAWLTLLLTEWMPRPSAHQLAALEALRPEPPNVSGARNAFAALYLLPYEIPAEELERVAAADVQAYAQDPRGFVSTAKDKYPGLAEGLGIGPVLCAPWEANCLQRVRSDIAATRARVADLAAHLQRVEALAAYDHYRYAFTARLDSPLGVNATGAFPAIMTTAALDFVDGKVDAAFQRLCRNTAIWRRLRAHSDYLIVDMLGAAQMSGAIRLYAEMLAEMPADFVAPCPETFAPLADAELDQCAVFRSEFLLGQNLVDDLSRGQMTTTGTQQEATLGTRMLGWVINKRHLSAIGAGNHGRYCMAEHKARAAARSPQALSEVPLCSSTEWIFDPLGCQIFVIATPSYDPYYLRILDLDARLKLLNAAIWLRSQPVDGDRAAQFAARPEQLKSPGHELVYDADSASLQMNNLDKNRGEFWQIPFGVATAAAPAAGAPGDPPAAR